MNWIVSKASGVDSIGETCDKSVDALLRANGVTQVGLKLYKADRSYDPRFYLRTYVGDVVVDGSRRGAIIEVDEASGQASGVFCERELIGCRDFVHTSYLKWKLDGMPEAGLANHFDEEQTGKRTPITKLES